MKTRKELASLVNSVVSAREMERRQRAQPSAQWLTNWGEALDEAITALAKELPLTLIWQDDDPEKSRADAALTTQEPDLDISRAPNHT